MQKLFTKILVPVSFSRNTRWSVDKAIQLANKFDCDILLLHVKTPTSGIPFFKNAFFHNAYIRFSHSDLTNMIKELEQQHKPKLKPGLLMSSAIGVGNWQSVLKDVIIAEHVDLTVIPRSKKRTSRSVIRRISINKLSQQTNCPIMTITRSFNANNLQNIVVPVNDVIPVKKLTMATYLSYENSGCIYLRGKEDHSASTSQKKYLMKSYRLLHDFGKMNIKCDLGDNDDSATGTLAYAKNVKANLIVVNPGQESRLKGWLNKLRGKYLCRESDIPVLTVAI